jgi:MFS family permease
MVRFRKVERPILDPRVFRHPSFLAGIGGGTMFRIGVSAIPFLMPMLLQIGFGFSAFASGSITFANAIGSMISKPVALRLLRYFSYRRLLVAITGISGSTLALFLLFRPSTPPLLIFLVLLAGSIARSLQITFSNAVAYADVPDGDTAQANAIANVMQQLAASLAIALAATLLHVGQTLHGDATLDWRDFSFPFAMLSLLGFGSIVFYWWLPPSTGEDMRSGPVEA